jgi:uncharacterized protein (DUF885 family)
MKMVLRILLWMFLAALAVGAYLGYRIGWGQPFDINQLANRQALAFVTKNPELLTAIGAVDGTPLDFHSGKLSEVTIAKRDQDYADAAKYLTEVKAWDRAKLGFQDQLTYDVLVDQYSSAAEYKKFDWLGAGGVYPFNQMTGLQTQLPGFLQSSHTIKNAKTAETYVQRLEQLARVIDEGIAEMNRQAKLGATPPVEVIDRTQETISDFLKPQAKAHPLAGEYAKKLAALKDLDQKKKDTLQNRAEAAVANQVYPAYQRLAAALAAIRPEAAKNPAAGMARLPDGAAYYALALKQQTTTNMTPDQVHDYGLAEVARITAEMDAILTAQGIVKGTVGERTLALGEDPRFQYEDSEAGRAKILADYDVILKDISKKMPEFFGVIPTQKLEVVRVPAFAEAGSAGAYFEPAALDGSRPGRFFANLRNVKETPTWSMKTLAYHEGIPGHFHQISVAQKLEGLPLIRQQPIYTAYAEGWALYAEHLAKEMGMYENDPFGDLGRLQAEIFRAARLVVDTGLHAKGWTHKQAIDYMVAATGMAPTDVTREVERYMVMPGQACAYKIGMKAILDERERAKAALGDKFSLKGFNDAVLGSGAVPLIALPRVVDHWIDAAKKAQ